MIGGSPVFNVKINGKDIPNNDDIPSALGEITSTSSITLSPPNLTKEEVRLRVKTSKSAKEQILTVDQIGTWTPLAKTYKYLKSFSNMKGIFFLNDNDVKNYFKDPDFQEVDDYFILVNL